MLIAQIVAHHRSYLRQSLDGTANRIEASAARRSGGFARIYRAT